MAEQPTPGTRVTDLPVVAVEELLRSMPRLFERTLHQAELARALAAHLPCVGGLFGSRPSNEAPGTRAPEPVGVLDLFDEPSAATSSTTNGSAASVAAAPGADPGEPSGGPSPVEADLAVPDYDSLAASQVVPRLAMLSPQDLRDVLAYERSHRRRQTILNRVTQLLEA